MSKFNLSNVQLKAKVSRQPKVVEEKPAKPAQPSIVDVVLNGQNPVIVVDCRDGTKEQFEALDRKLGAPIIVALNYGRFGGVNRENFRGRLPQHFGQTVVDLSSIGGGGVVPLDSLNRIAEACKSALEMPEVDADLISE